MKYIHIYIWALLSVLFVACSDDTVGLNSHDVKVAFAQSDISLNENAGIVSIPLSVEGERNGLVKMTFKVTGVTAVENEHYLVTTTTLQFDAETETIPGLEIRLLDDGDTENDDRTLTVTIEQVEGAQKGAISTCNVTLVDVDKNPYFKLMGDWTFTGVNVATDETETFTVNISNNGDESLVEKSYIGTGFLVEAGVTLEWKLNYNKSSETLSLVEGPSSANAYDFGSFVGVFKVIPMEISEQDLVPIRSIQATWSEAFDKVTFEPEGVIGGGVFVRDTGGYAGWYVGYIECSMTKK
jgi:hypothetical protein